MPIKSKASLSAIHGNRKTRLRAPAWLGEAEARVWNDLVSACGPGHFAESDAPALEHYCQCACLAQQASDALATQAAVIDGRLNPWITVQEKMVKSMIALAMRLRLSPQARLRRETTGRRGPPASAYELMRDMGDDE